MSVAVLAKACKAKQKSAGSYIRARLCLVRCDNRLLLGRDILSKGGAFPYAGLP